MSKIVLILDGMILKELTLTKERTTIGRRPHNDLVIDSRAISGEHAVIVVMPGGVTIEDLDSTNGTAMNGQPITKQKLKHNDLIELAKYQIQYIEESDPLENKLHPAVIRAVSGRSLGKELALSKEHTRIGQSGVQIAVIEKRLDGYFLVQQEGPLPIVNGKSLIHQGQYLQDHDIIELSGIMLEFFLSNLHEKAVTIVH